MKISKKLKDRKYENTNKYPRVAILISEKVNF